MSSGACPHRRELGLSIANEGNWEEYHQKRGDFYMYDHHKGRRLRLEKEYRRRFGDTPHRKPNE